MSNTIKRTTKNFIDIVWLIDTSHTKKGDKSHLTRHPYLSGWTDGKGFIPTSYIRNENLCRIVEQG